MTNKRLDTIHPSRRRVLRALSVVAAGGAAACGRSGQDSTLSIESLRSVSRVHGSQLTDERLAAIRPAIEQQLVRLEAVRGFDLDETVEPATVFMAKREPESIHPDRRRARG